MSKIGRPATHGHYTSGKTSSTANIWKRMIDRCHRPNDAAYSAYGGRGIAVCQEWRDSLPTFIADMGLRPDGMQIDRVDNDAGYNKDNCRWASRSQQARNRRDTFRVRVDGVSIPLADLSHLAVLPLRSVKKRIVKGWAVMDALQTPPALARKADEVTAQARATQSLHLPAK